MSDKSQQKELSVVQRRRIHFTGHSEKIAAKYKSHSNEEEAFRAFYDFHPPFLPPRSKNGDVCLSENKNNQPQLWETDRFESNRSEGPIQIIQNSNDACLPLFRKLRAPRNTNRSLTRSTVLVAAHRPRNPSIEFRLIARFDTSTGGLLTASRCRHAKRQRNRWRRRRKLEKLIVSSPWRSTIFICSLLSVHFKSTNW